MVQKVRLRGKLCILCLLLSISSGVSLLLSISRCFSCLFLFHFTVCGTKAWVPPCSFFVHLSSLCQAIFMADRHFSFLGNSSQELTLYVRILLHLLRCFYKCVQSSRLLLLQLGLCCRQCRFRKKRCCHDHARCLCFLLFLIPW